MMNTVVNNNWKALLMFIHCIEFILSFNDLSCKIMHDEENMFLMNRLFSVVMYWMALLSVFDLEPTFFELLHFSQDLVNV